MQLLEAKKETYTDQADPFIFEAKGKFCIYTTGKTDETDLTKIKFESTPLPILIPLC